MYRYVEESYRLWTHESAVRVRRGDSDSLCVKAPELLQLVNGEAGEDLGVEVGRLLRHHAAGEGRIGHLLDRRGFQQEGDLRSSLPRLFDGVVESAHVAQV